MRKILVSLTCAALAWSVAGCAADDDSGSDGSGDGSSALKIAAIFPASTTAAGWDREGNEAIESMSEDLGAKLSIVESVSYDSAAQTLDRLASEGNDVVISHSSGFEPAVLEVAPDYPDTQFILFSNISTTDAPANVAAWKINWNELGYLVGTAMCTISTTGIIGHVSSAPIPAFTRMAGGIEQATENEGTCKDQDDPLKITFTGSFTDLAAAKSGALKLIDEGASVLSDGADAAGAGVVSTAEEKGIPYVGGFVDIAEWAPDLIATSIAIDFESAYAQAGSLLADDSIEPSGIYDVNVESGGLYYVSPVINVPNADEVTAALDSAISRIKDGSLDVDPTREIQG